MTVEHKACLGLAFFYARDRKRLNDLRALRWAQKHWLDFMNKLDTPNGKFFLLVARGGEEQE